MGLEALLVEAQQRGFLGPTPVGRQLEHSHDLIEALADEIGEFEGSFLDLGSGAGLPGLVFAERFPLATGVLLDSQRKRCEFLETALAEMGFSGRCSVACGRAEELARRTDLRGSFDLVVARAFGPPATTAECGVGFLAVGGRLAVSEPPAEPAVEARGPTGKTTTRTTTSARWPQDRLAELGLQGPVYVRQREASAAVMSLATLVSDRWPRRVGVPTKRPLWV